MKYQYVTYLFETAKVCFAAFEYASDATEVPGRRKQGLQRRFNLELPVVD